MDASNGSTDDERGDQERPVEGSLDEPVYNDNDDGELVGRARDPSEDGFSVSRRTGLADLSVEHVRSGHEFGEAELVWRCLECGEMGELDEGLPDEGLPDERLLDECPNSGAERGR